MAFELDRNKANKELPIQLDVEHVSTEYFDAKDLFGTSSPEDVINDMDLVKRCFSGPTVVFSPSALKTEEGRYYYDLINEATDRLTQSDNCHFNQGGFYMLVSMKASHLLTSLRGAHKYMLLSQKNEAIAQTVNEYSVPHTQEMGEGTKQKEETPSVSTMSCRV